MAARVAPILVLQVQHSVKIDARVAPILVLQVQHSVKIDARVALYSCCRCNTVSR